MKKFIEITILVFFVFINFSANAHFQHYDNLKVLKYDLFRNNKNIGTHTFVFTKDENGTKVESDINFEIKKLGISIYKYKASGVEIYDKDGQLIKFNSNTDQNGKKKFVNMKLLDGKYLIDGSSYNGDAKIDFLIGTWWNHSIIKAPAQISAVSGRIIEQKVEFVGKETLSFNNKNFKSLHFKFSSSDPKLKKNKRLNTDIWYEEESLVWIYARFEKTGVWEYRLSTLEEF